MLASLFNLLSGDSTLSSRNTRFLLLSLEAQLEQALLYLDQCDDPSAYLDAVRASECQPQLIQHRLETATGKTRARLVQSPQDVLEELDQV